MSFLQIVAVLFFLVYLFFALCLKQTVMEAEGDVSLTCCYCELTADAKEISKEGKPHVHCPCEKCMTAWGHMKSERHPSLHLLKKHVKRWKNWTAQLWKILWNMKRTNLNSKVLFVLKTVTANFHTLVMFALGPIARVMIMMIIQSLTIVVLVVQGQLMMMKQARLAVTMRKRT